MPLFFHRLFVSPMKALSYQQQPKLHLMKNLLWQEQLQQKDRYLIMILHRMKYLLYNRPLPQYPYSEPRSEYRQHWFHHPYKDRVRHNNRQWISLNLFCSPWKSLSLLMFQRLYYRICFLIEKLLFWVPLVLLFLLHNHHIRFRVRRFCLVQCIPPLLVLYVIFVIESKHLHNLLEQIWCLPGGALLLPLLHPELSWLYQWLCLYS